MGDGLKGFVLMDSAVMTNLQGRGIDKRYSGDFSKSATLQVRDQRHQRSLHQLNKSGIAN